MEFLIQPPQEQPKRSSHSKLRAIKSSSLTLLNQKHGTLDSTLVNNARFPTKPRIFFLRPHSRIHRPLCRANPQEQRAFAVQIRNNKAPLLFRHQYLGCASASVPPSALHPYHHPLCIRTTLLSRIRTRFALAHSHKICPRAFAQVLLEQNAHVLCYAHSFVSCPCPLLRPQHVDIDSIKEAGITKFRFEFGGKTSAFIAAVADSNPPKESILVKTLTRGPLIIRSYTGDLTEETVKHWRSSTAVLKIVAHPSEYKVFFLKESLHSLKEKNPAIFYRAGKRKSTRKM
jgi:hypothetical protein